jgi:hypothetical protein
MPSTVSRELSSQQPGYPSVQKWTVQVKRNQYQRDITLRSGRVGYTNLRAALQLTRGGLIGKIPDVQQSAHKFRVRLHRIENSWVPSHLESD